MQLYQFPITEVLVISDTFLRVRIDQGFGVEKIVTVTLQGVGEIDPEFVNRWVSESPVYLDSDRMINASHCIGDIIRTESHESLVALHYTSTFRKH